MHAIGTYLFQSKAVDDVFPDGRIASGRQHQLLATANGGTTVKVILVSIAKINPKNTSPGGLSSFNYSREVPNTKLVYRLPLHCIS